MLNNKPLTVSFRATALLLFKEPPTYAKASVGRQPRNPYKQRI